MVAKTKKASKAQRGLKFLRPKGCEFLGLVTINDPKTGTEHYNLFHWDWYYEFYKISTGESRKVTLYEDGGASCDCPARKGGKACRHVAALHKIIEEIGLYPPSETEPEKPAETIRTPRYVPITEKDLDSLLGTLVYKKDNQQPFRVIDVGRMVINLAAAYEEDATVFAQWPDELMANFDRIA